MHDDTLSPDLLERYRRIPVAVLSDVMAKAGCPDQLLSHELRSFDGSGSFAGPAFCVRGQSTGGNEHPPDIRFEMYRRIHRGAVMVVATGGYRTTAILGENMTVALKQRGCQAIVLDGPYRDRSSIAALGVPVRARFVTPTASGGRYAIVACDEAVQMPGQSQPAVTVHPGDLVVGDEEGVIVIPRRGVHSIAEDAERVIAAEERTRERMQAGEDAEQAYKANDRFGHVRKI
ncbi:RraA family protein [Verticiella sediminum]|uniref:Putative 4-hydroxy-4-methyl-2-oxoglutarate aldolase n=1 Tax=Verticiella sediminum TaxID=1247510 RepID=A0A556AJ71_9BURK|nr:RraA family protein [Verticiella sediminum]TSH92954.1 RraA family protein [Verticiella sediminum]